MDEDALSPQLSPAQMDPNDDLLLDFEALIQTGSGRNVLMWLLEQAGLYGSLYAVEPGLTEVNIGRRDMGLRLLSKLEEVSPIAYPRMLLDYASDRMNAKKEPHVLDQD